MLFELDPTGRRARRRHALTCALLLSAACNDDAEAPRDGAQPDASAGLSEPDAGPVAGDAPADPRERVRVLSLSEAGHDRLYAVTHDHEGYVYAAGQLSEDSAEGTDFALAVVKVNAEGERVPGFGADGLVVTNLAVGGGSAEVARAIALQSDGKVVIAGTIEHDVTAPSVLARDTDIVLVRYAADGQIDTSFGSDGVVTLDLGEGVETAGASGPTLSGADAVWSLAVGEGDALFVHGVQRATGVTARDGTPRTDTDWVIIKLSADGALDAGFGSGGKVTLDLGEANASARSASLLGDGSIVGTGYATTTLLGASTQQPVLYKVTPEGAFDPSFATADATEAPGVFYDYVTARDKRAEAYGAAVQGDQLVTVGYGPTAGTGTGTDWVFLRFTGEGVHDLTFGTDGLTYVDVAGYADNGRAVLVLPDQRIMAFGGGRPAPASAPAADAQPPADGMIVQLTKDGALDPSFGSEGVKLYDFGGAGDFFWAGSLAADGASVAVAGIATGADSSDDDAVLVFLPLD
jgi:uncharacterized delta-60 repeat protein